MSSQTRNQEYRYQYKTVAVANAYFCGNGPTMNVSVPDNLLDIKAIFMHAVLRFNTSVPTAKRKVLWVGGSYPVRFEDGFAVPDAERGNMIRIDLPANTSTCVADVKIDLTHLKEGILETLANTNFAFEQPKIQLSIITNETPDFGVDGDVILWKIDFAYTTTGIQ